MIYFDHNATAPLLPEARAAWLNASEEFAANPSSPHRAGARAEAALQQAREQLAQTLGCDAWDLVWTSGATESNNAVFHHLAATAPADAEAWVSAIEHPCVLEAVRRYFPRRHRLIPVLASGMVDLDWLRAELARRKPALVGIMAANNETGVLQPWAEARALCQEAGVPFFCDAAQWLGRYPAHGLGACDWVSGCAHKFGGPKGVGFLKCTSTGTFRPLLVGGPQEEGRRAGTENVPGVLAMVAALGATEGALARGEDEPRAAWRDAFERAVRSRHDDIEILGTDCPRLWNTSLLLMPA
ncbi:MAG TPA: aminotransferase class V-fold PLP-dependent enzyme, partial [Methylomirabilota bacterium]|nr:aminotransferase class V-fold PLP-dependent enzyme [Methylomirabilota bacterium]